MTEPANPLSDNKIVESWKNNVEPWITAIQNDAIATRVQTTNRAIVDAVLQCRPGSALDIGCGEGWLVRHLVDAGVDALGTDVVTEFIHWARKQGKGRFQVLPYDELCNAALGEQFDVAICNFSLLGKESVDELFRRIPGVLNEGGNFIVQTLHPVTSCGNTNYQDGWRHGSWSGFGEDFRDPAPWYFRTLETWKSLFVESGFKLSQILEPRGEQNDRPVSIIFVAQAIAPTT